jgi:hypothetical protein
MLALQIKRMESYMLKILKQKNPDIVYPSNVGKIWTEEEENVLIEELNSSMGITTIASLHGRTVHGIECRIRQIVYKMDMNGASIEEIVSKTKLHAEEISALISRKEKQMMKIPKEKKIAKGSKDCNCCLEIKNLKQEIEELKTGNNEILRLIREIYEFESQ